MRIASIVSVVILIFAGLEFWDRPIVSAKIHGEGYRVHKAQSLRKCGELSVVAGALRNFGDGWQIVTNKGHIAVNVASIRTTATAIFVNFPDMGQRQIVTFVASPDETLALNGYHVGASVGLKRAAIKFSRQGWYGPKQVSPLAVDTNRYPQSNIWFHGLLAGAHCPFKSNT